MIKAAVIERPGTPPRVQEFPEPTLEENSGLMRVLRSEVCGTDVHLFHGRLAETPYPLIPGHINVGKLEKIKGDLRDVDGNDLVPGDIVTFMDVHATCHNCWYCLVAKESTRCPHRKVYGITYGVKDGLCGGWAEKVYLKPGLKLLKIGVDPDTFIGGGCGLPTAFHGVERSGIRLGDTVVVQGSGPVGLNAVALARLSGALRIILVGAPAMRLEMGKRFGADEVVDITGLSSDEIVDNVLELTGKRGADVTIEATGVATAIPQGLKMTRDGGVYTVLGQYTDSGEVAINPHWDINKKHVEIRGTWGIDFSHFYRSIKVMERYADRIPWKDMVTRVYGLDECDQALRDVEKTEVVKAAIDPQRSSTTSIFPNLRL